jgi:hypothetical protein
MSATGSTLRKGGAKRVVLSLLAIFAAVVGVLCLVIISRPDDFKYQRSATFKATPAAVFEQVNDFHKWNDWSPWAKMDPNAKGTYEGPTAGKDAKFSWDGNSDVGAGSMTIVESKPDDVVLIKLSFIRPMPGDCDVEMKIQPKGDETSLTWTMTGKNGFMGKAFGLFVDCEEMCGKEFDKGLATMKGIVENPPDRKPEGDAAVTKPSDT